MRVAVVAEFYPRRRDPVLGVWAHRQALAAAHAGAEVSVFVLHRLVPPRADPRALWTLMRQPPATRLDGLEVRYVRYASPPRSRSYARWGAYAAPALRRALRRSGPFDLVHAHYAVPAADAVLRAGVDLPFVVSVHGGDVLWTSSRVPGGREAVERGLSAARLVLANSAGTEALSREHGARATRVVHLGTDVPAAPGEPASEPLIVTVGHLVARKRHADVLRSLAELPGVGYLIVGDGPERVPLERLAAELGVAARVEFAGQLAPDEAARRLAAAWCFAMPSTDEAFGVAYIEAMAAGVPAIGRAGEAGPVEIARAGGGIELAEPETLTAVLRRLTGDRAARDALGAAARETVLREFTWPLCGERTLAAYAEALS
ncbi:MAG TPA: glycosyltransferase [Solirubrobacteraceae bacterium]|nr:glycosyltransferase [Solirubrobacteraceae bacterium]